MAGDFVSRIDQLQWAVGIGDLVVKVEMDQVYAKYQHERTDLRHPRGGEAGYLRNALHMNQGEYLQHLANRLLTADGSDLVSGAVDVARQLSRQGEQRAPVEFVNLRRSGHPTVTDNGAVVFDEPPAVPRLSEEQLRAQRRHGHSLDYGAHSRPRLS